ncbi:putative glutamate--cysteine ligase 2 [Streptomyces avidinii]
MSPSLDGALLQVALGRALTTYALRLHGEGSPCTRRADVVLRLARWQAAREGLEGYGIDPWTGDRTPASALGRRLVDLVGTELEATGDYDHVSRTLDGLLRHGSWPARQRAVFSARTCPTDVPHYLAEETEDL